MVRSPREVPCCVGGKKVLVVDDDVAVLNLNCCILEQVGMVPVAARSATEALDRLEVHGDSISLAVLDVDMPGMDGFQLCRSIRQRHPDLAVVFISGHERSDILVRLAEAQPAEFLPKPYPPSQLRSVVDTCLRRYAAESAG